MSSTSIEHLRQLIEDTLCELGLPDADWSCVKAKDGQSRLGTRTPPSQILAVWLTDQNVLQFHGENGHLLTTVGLEKEGVAA
jgi:hypothetical protein